MTITPDVLDIPRHGSVNVHFSLLPRWLVAAPVQRAILEGDERTGVTVMLMDEGMVRSMFTQRRKTLGNALRPFADACGRQPGAVLAAAGIDPRRRAETLQLSEFARLADQFRAG